ncbi:MAG: class I SAM-dependent methyltransferase [Bacteroidales bacterium]|nr:class I SAM-dependent methyltransferase [Bacteroidales bacterium]
MNNELDNFLGLLKGNKVMDAGCGTGRDTQYLFNNSCNVIGVDISEKMLAIARNNRKNCIFVQSDLRKLDFEQNSFDGIWCSAVMPHYEDFEINQILKSLKKNLKSNGVLFISFKIGNGLHIDTTYSSPRKMYYHTIKNCESFLIKNGFKIITKDTFNERDRYGKNYRDINYLTLYCTLNNDLNCTQQCI